MQQAIADQLINSIMASYILTQKEQFTLLRKEASSM